MKKIFLVLFVCVSSAISAQNKDSVTIRNIYTEVLLNGKCYNTLEYLCNEIGGRLSGSPEAAQAVAYTAQQLYQYGADTVYLQSVVVPHWVRGPKERGFIKRRGKEYRVRICALGNSIATPIMGLTAPVIEVKSIKELDSLGFDKVNGRIVFFNRPLNPIHIHTGKAYGEAGDQRGIGAIVAAKYGAVGAIVRSLTLANDTNPHTGMMRYEDSIQRIPACAISTKDADILSSMIKEDTATEFYFYQDCKMYFDELSYNVIGEIRGSEKKDEIIVVGGHLDSWDNGDGAHDDGAGVVQSMEVIRILKALKLKPKRTIKCVLFMNEENGVRGGKKFAEEVVEKKEKVIAAIESDGGGFTPRGFNLDDSLAVKRFQKWVPLLSPYGIEHIKRGHTGTDIGPLKSNGTITIGYEVDSQRYFDIHHTAIDTFDKVNKRELELGAASMCSLVWLMSEYGVGK